jgi:N-methylhydantoinase A
VHSAQPALERIQEESGSPAAARLGAGKVWFSARRSLSTPLYRRADLRWKDVIAGPAVIFQADSTTVIGPGWTAVVDEWGNLVLSL